MSRPIGGRSRPLPVAPAAELLAARATAPQPFLFERPEIDWRWHSYRAVAAEVAERKEAPEPATTPDPRWSVDAVVTFLASGDAPAAVPGDAVGRLVDLMVSASDPPDGAGAGRPVLLAACGPCEGSDATAPDPALVAITIAALAADAAWVVEPAACGTTPLAASVFAGTARWTRPSVLVAPPGHLDAAAAAWDDGDRRWSRLHTVVVTGEADAAERERWQAVLGCRVLDAPCVSFG